jgi:hypothetical protein
LRLVLLVLTGFIAFDLSAGADSLSDMPPDAEFRASISGVRPTLGPHRTYSEMIAFVGAEPQRCVPVSQKSRICVWALSKRQPGWRPLASALGTGDRLNLVCEFPASKGPRAEASCSAHAQRSNRTYYRTFVVKKRGQRKTPDWRSNSQRAEAQKLIDSATTAFALSTLVGDAPDQCTESPSQTHCVWKTDARTYGQGTLAVSIGANFSKKVRLSCSLPAGGGPRDQHSCSAQIGS